MTDLTDYNTLLAIMGGRTKPPSVAEVEAAMAKHGRREGEIRETLAGPTLPLDTVRELEHELGNLERIAVAVAEVLDVARKAEAPRRVKEIMKKIPASAERAERTLAEWKAAHAELNDLIGTVGAYRDQGGEDCQRMKPDLFERCLAALGCRAVSFKGMTPSVGRVVTLRCRLLGESREDAENAEGVPQVVRKA